MDYIDRYIDSNIISEFADKDLTNGYTLHIVDVPEHDLTNLVDLMLKKDEVLRDIILDHVQKRINDRLPEYEMDHRAYLEDYYGRKIIT